MRQNIDRPNVTINGLTIPQLWSYTQTTSISEFQDKFTLTIGGKDKLWKEFTMNDTITATILGKTNSFTIDTRNITGNYNSPIKIDIKGESAEYLEFLDNAEPKKYYRTTDDSILSDIGMTVVSDESVKIDEFSIQSGEKKLDVAKRLANRSGFLLYVNAGTIYKKRLASSGGSVKTYIDDLTEETARENTYKLLDRVTRTEMVKHCAKTIKAYSQDNKFKNIKGETSVDLSLIFSEGSVKTNRVEYMQVDASDIGELDKIREDNARKFMPIELLSFRVKGKDDIKLNDIASIKFQRFNINTPMVLYKKDFNMRDGEFTTTLYFCRVGGTFR